MTPEEVRQIIREELQALLGSSQFTFQKDIKIFDGRNIQVGRTSGTTIGTASDQKLSVYGATPVVRAGAISTVTVTGSAEDALARAAVNSIITAIKNFGITS